MSERVTHPENEPVNAEELLARYDRESDYRRLFGFFARVISAITIAFSVFQLYTALFGTLDAHLQRAVHLSFALALTYLLYPASRK